MRTSTKYKLAVIALAFASAWPAHAELAVDNAGGATLLGAFGATLNSTVISTGSANPELTIYYGTADGGTNKAAWSNSVAVGTVGTGEHGIPVVGLSQGTVYRYRAYVTNATAEAWAASSSIFTSRTAVVAARSLSISPTNDAIVNAPDFAQDNELVDYGTGNAWYVRRDGTTPAQALQVRSMTAGATILTNGTFATTAAWSWIGNASRGAASNTTFAAGGWGLLTVDAPIPPGVYELVRSYTSAGGNNWIFWGTGAESGGDEIAAGTVVVTNIVRAGGTLSFDSAPDHAIYLNWVELRPYAGGPVSGGAGLFDSLHVRERPKVGADQAALMSDLDAFQPVDAAGFVVKAPTIVAFDQDLDGPWYATIGGAYTNAAGWYTTGTPTNNGIGIDSDAIIVSPVLADGFAFAEWNGGQNRIINRQTVTPQTSTNLVTWTPAARTTQPVYFRLITGQLPPVPGDTNVVSLVTNVTIYAWQYPEHAFTTQDLSGTIIEVAPAVGPREPVTKAQLDGPVAALQVQIDEWSRIPAVTPIRDGGHGYMIGSYWHLHAGNNLYLDFGGHRIVEIGASAVAPPDIVAWSVTTTNITLVVLGTPGFAVVPQYSTNAVDWITISTNDFASTFPDLVNDTYTLTFAPPGADLIWYRAVTEAEASGTTTDAGATFNVPVYAENLWYFRADPPANSLADAEPRTIAVDGTNAWICVAEDFLGAGTNWMRLQGEVVLP